MARLFDREQDLGDSLFVSTDGRRFRLRSPGLGCRGSVITLSDAEATALVAYIKLVRVIAPDTENPK